MLSFSRLGKFGRLGNQMFQYAFLRSKANQLGVPYSCPAWRGDTLFKLNETNRIVSAVPAGPNQYTEPPLFVGYNESTSDIGPNTEIIGYFQTAKYFGSQARDWFQFREKLDTPNSLCNTTSLHIRLTDYVLKQQFHPIQSLEYYEKAIRVVDADSLLVFSDDIAEAKKRLEKLTTDNLFFSENNPDYVDLQLMMYCGSNIIANSSFSWWGAYLNQNKKPKVIYPSLWFTDSFGAKNPDIAPHDWFCI